MIAREDAERYYQAGVVAKAAGHELPEALMDYFGHYQDWSAYACFKLGFAAQPFEIKIWERYGEIRTERYSGQPLPSYNHLDDRPEHGVSVIYPDWANTVHGMFYIAHAETRGRKRISFRGIDTGHYGGDGEPLVIPVA